MEYKITYNDYSSGYVSPDWTREVVVVEEARCPVCGADLDCHDIYCKVDMRCPACGADLSVEPQYEI